MNLISLKQLNVFLIISNLVYLNSLSLIKFSTTNEVIINPLLPQIQHPLSKPFLQNFYERKDLLKSTFRK